MFQRSTRPLTRDERATLWARRAELEAMIHRPPNPTRRSRELGTFRWLALAGVFFGAFALFCALTGRLPTGWISTLGAIAFAVAALWFYRARMVAPHPAEAELGRVDEALRSGTVAVVELEADEVVGVDEPDGRCADVYRVTADEWVWLRRSGAEHLPSDGRVPARVRVELPVQSARTLERSGPLLTPSATLAVDDAESFFELHFNAELIPFRTTLETLRAKART
ncbi:MAG: hypothetical protein IRZ16_00160 [Myxococcaceae bacterium]|nr:hypothetical protein [Myxococcaceae bacterium]